MASSSRQKRTSGTGINHCYWLTVRASNWSQSQQECEDSAGYLATVTSKDEEVIYGSKVLAK